MALAIQKEEKKRHGNNWRCCLRKKTGSTKASAVFLEACNPPGGLKRLAFQADKMLRCLSDPPAQDPDTWYGQLWSKAKAKAVNGFIPLLRTVSFILDYVKDLFLFVYIFSKRAFITSTFIQGLVIFHGLTILTSGVLMGLAVQFDNTIVNLDSFVYPDLTWLIRFVIFVATPIMPVVVILRALKLTTEKRRLVAEWRRKQESISKMYLRHSKLDREKRKVMKALADMKMVEVSTEGVPQLFILIVLIIFSADNDSCVGLLEDDIGLSDITFLGLSLLQTYMTIILSTIGSINIRKGGQLDVKSKIVLGLSVSCQLAAKLWITVFIAVAASFPDEGIPLDSGVLLLLLPIPIGWASNILLHARLNTDFCRLSAKDRLIHLLSTTWVTIPVRRMGDRDQRHKGRETFFALLLAGINLVGTLAALAVTAAQQGGYVMRRFGGAFVVVVCVMLPSLFFHLAGCGWLLLYEKTVHPWRQLGKERESHCWGKLQGTKRGIEAEPTL